jgi:transcriptional regulator with XRE-family HTH domain
MTDDTKFTSDELKKLGQRLKNLRKAKGYTNYEYFAYEHGLPRSQYGRYESGKDLRYSTLLKLIKIHGMTVAEFFSFGFE